MLPTTDDQQTHNVIRPKKMLWSYRNKPTLNELKPVSLTCHSVLNKLYAEPSIDASYHGHFVQAKRFQFFSSKLSNQKQEFHMAAMFLNKSRRDEKYL